MTARELDCVPLTKSVLLLAPTPVSDVIEGCQVDARLRAVTAARRLMVH